jgi:hypothetical protein
LHDALCGFVGTDHDRERHAARVGRLHLLAELLVVERDLARDAGAPERGRDAERRGLELPGEDGDPDLEVRLSLRPHPELFHDDRDAIDPERRADGRQRAPREHADQVVVATAATERSDLRLGDAHLPHAARVVVESAGERVVDGDPILLHAEVRARDP